MIEGNQHLNLAREFVSRLQNVCYNHTVIQVINALAQNTNYEKATYYGGMIALRRQTHLSAAAIKSAVRKLTMDGVIEKEMSRGDMFHRGMRQNYRLILPPLGIDTCAMWEGHNKSDHHLDGFSDLEKRLSDLARDEFQLRTFQSDKNPKKEQPDFNLPDMDDESLGW